MHTKHKAHAEKCRPILLREHAQHVKRALDSFIFVSHSLWLVNMWLLIRCELVLVSFQIGFQFVMFSPNEHIRRVFVRICAYSNLVRFLPFAIRSRYVTSIRYSVKAP